MLGFMISRWRNDSYSVTIDDKDDGGWLNLKAPLPHCSIVKRVWSKTWLNNHMGAKIMQEQLKLMMPTIISKQHRRAQKCPCN
jgi:hypothetical protein